MWPLANLASQNFAEIRGHGLYTLLQPLGFVAIGLAISVVCAAVLGRWTRGGAASVSSALSVLALALFGYTAWMDGVGALFAARHWPGDVVSAYWCVVALTAVFVLWCSRHAAFRTVLAIGILAGAALPCAAFIAALARPAAAVSWEPSEGEHLPLRPLSGENVYYFILDGYPGSEGLRAFFDFDNQPFIRRMQQRGFFVADRARSNYAMTYVALAALFRMDYPVEAGDPRYMDRSAFYPSMLDSERAPLLLSQLHAAGYTTWHSANSWGPCTGRHLACVDSVAGSMNFVTQTFLKPTPLNAWAAGKFVVGVDAITPVASAHRTLLASAPMFLFAHHLPPHPPHVFDAACSERKIVSAELRSSPEAVDMYRDSVVCVNRRIEEMVDAIVQADPDALVVVQSDHGSDLRFDADAPLDGWTAEAINERSSIVNMIRAPAECRQWLRPALGPINTVRFVMACLNRQAPDYVDEKLVLTVYETSPDYGLARDIDAGDAHGR